MKRSEDSQFTWLNRFLVVLRSTLDFGFQFVADVVRLRMKRSRHRLSRCVRILTNSATSRLKLEL